MEDEAKKRRTEDSGVVAHLQQGHTAWGIQGGRRQQQAPRPAGGHP
jgi:hypothetical protein